MKKPWILVCGSALLFAVACADAGNAVAEAEDAVGLADADEPAIAADAPVAAAEQAKPAAPATPGSAAQRPAEAPAQTRKLVSPVRGEAPIEYTAPQAKRDGNFIVTTFKVKNVASAPIAGFKVDEFWYDKAGNAVTGAPTFRHRSPLQPGEVIDVTLRVPSHPQMNSNTFKFEHQNGSIKPTRVPKL
jgi:hypothetical protein